MAKTAKNKKIAKYYENATNAPCECEERCVRSTSPSGSVRDGKIVGAPKILEYWSSLDRLSEFFRLHLILAIHLSC